MKYSQIEKRFVFADKKVNIYCICGECTGILMNYSEKALFFEIYNASGTIIKDSNTYKSYNNVLVEDDVEKYKIITRFISEFRLYLNFLCSKHLHTNSAGVFIFEKSYTEKINLDFKRFTKLTWYKYLNSLSGIIKPVATSSLPTSYGVYKMVGFENAITGEYHIALIYGDIGNSSLTIPIRIHSECLTGDSFSSLKCDCGSQLQAAFRYIRSVGYGVILYMKQEGRGIGILNKIRAYGLQDRGENTVSANILIGYDADERDYAFANAILHFLRVKRIQLLTNNPLKIKEIEQGQYDYIERIPLIIKPNRHNSRYMKTKKELMGHLL